MINFKNICSILISIILVGFIWWIIFLFNILPKNYYSKTFPDSPYDTGIVVLTGGKMRIERGMEILQKGYAEKMFISGVFMPSEIETKFRIEKSKKDLLDCCINFGAEAKNTIENAVEVNQWLSDNSEIIKINQRVYKSTHCLLDQNLLVAKTLKGLKIHLAPICLFL